jgi:hypothetical protein
MQCIILLRPVVYWVYAFCTRHIPRYKHTEPQTASSATLSLSTESHACITVRSSQARLQMHASEVLTQNKQVYCTWPSVGNPGRKLEPLDLASTPRDARYAMKLALHKPTLSSLRAPATQDDRVTPRGPICHGYTLPYHNHWQ